MDMRSSLGRREKSGIVPSTSSALALRQKVVGVPATPSAPG